MGDIVFSDGSDNWSKICETDTLASANAETNYPAFNWVNTYASQTANHVSGTAYASGWYLPTCVELLVMSANLATVNPALEAAGGTQIKTGDSDFYWSSNQNFGDYSASTVYTGICNLGSSLKSMSCLVCAIHAF